jgi:hypothetical protein
MKAKMALIAVAVVSVAAAGVTWAAFELTAAIQSELDKQKTVITSWAANPVLVNAVAEQNKKGPIAGMDNPKWKVTRRSDPLIIAFQSGPAGQFLKSKVAESQGAISEAFLSAAQGEKVAFVEKTTSYIHKGMPKFDVPYGTGRPWQGQAEFDESSQTYAIQVSVPVLSEGRPIGALVVGVNLSYLEKVVKK